MPNRDHWDFMYVSSDVAAAASVKREHHVNRIAFWEREQDDVVEQLRSAGVEVIEHQVTGGARHDVQFDPALTKRLSECRAKLHEHRQRVLTYEAFAKGLAANPNVMLELDVDDIRFFGLADEPPTKTGAVQTGEPNA